MTDREHPHSLAHEPNAEPTSSAAKQEERVDINFDGLRSAITPVNLMYDGRLFKDVKGLIGNITQAMKRVRRERPDYEGALREIEQLDTAFTAALNQWDAKLTGEIQRLKHAVETDPSKSLGATKQINKFQAELNRGRATTRTMPSKLGQVRNQLITAIGRQPAGSKAAQSPQADVSRLSQNPRKLPQVYQNLAREIDRKSLKLEASKFRELALSLLKGFSQVPRSVGDGVFDAGALHYLHASPLSDAEGTDDRLRQQAQFGTFIGWDAPRQCYRWRSLFASNESELLIPSDKLDRVEIDRFDPLGEMEMILKLLRSKFKSEDFVNVFNLYHTLRKKALADGREEKFNPRQLEIHQYLTGRIFEFVGIEYSKPADEIRFVGEINRNLQRID